MSKPILTNVNLNSQTCIYIMVFIDRWLLYRNTVSNNHFKKCLLCAGFLKKSACQIWHENYLGLNRPFTKFLEATNNLTKLVEVGKHLTKLIKFANNFTKFLGFAINFTKFVEFANNFTKFVGLTNNLKSEQKWAKTLQRL